MRPRPLSRRRAAGEKLHYVLDRDRRGRKDADSETLARTKEKAPESNKLHLKPNRWEITLTHKKSMKTWSNN